MLLCDFWLGVSTKFPISMGEPRLSLKARTEQRNTPFTLSSKRRANVEQISSKHRANNELAFPANIIAARRASSPSQLDRVNGV